MIAMLIGTVLALAALAYVLHPLLREGESQVNSDQLAPQRGGSAEMSAVDALRDVEFDYATGKLSDSDYRVLKASYMRGAADELAGGAESARACLVCGTRPEPDAAYCSNCGSALATPAPRGSTF